MIRNIFLLLSALLITAGSASAEKITIINIGDTHSCLSPGAPRDENLNGLSGGIARLATLKEMIRQQDTGVVLLHSGDFCIGDLFYNEYFGAAELGLLKQIGCDAMALGNHEFDLGPKVLELSIRAGFEAGAFPLLSANFKTNGNSALDTLNGFISKTAIITRNNLKIGIFGVTTPDANTISMPSPASFDDSVPKLAAEAVAALKSENCKIIIMLSHLGLEADKIVAANVDGIDLILGGHDHRKDAAPLQLPARNGGTVPAVYVGAYYQYAGKTVLEYKDNKVSIADFQLIKVDSAIQEAPPVKAAVDQMKGKIETDFGPMFSTKIAEAQEYFEETPTIDFTKPGILDTPVGNLVCDAFLDFGKTDIAIEPSGSTAQPLYKGPVTPDDIYRMIGYGFNTFNTLGYKMAKFKVKGSTILAGIELGLARLNIIDDYLLQTGGIKYTSDLTHPPLSRIVSVEVNGSAVDTSKLYSVTSNEFVVMMLQAMSLPIQDLDTTQKITEFEVVLNYITKLTSLTPGPTGRILPVDETTGPGEINSSSACPNPCADNVNISFMARAPEICRLDVYDFLGRIVMSAEHSCDVSGMQTMNLNTSGLARGIYQYKLGIGAAARFGGFIVSR